MKLKRITATIILFTVLIISGCAKQTTEFYFYFFPYGSTLEEDDWQKVANVNLVTRSQSFFTGARVNKIGVSIQTKGKLEKETFVEPWSTAQIIKIDGRWVSEILFRVSITRVEDEGNQTTSKIDINLKNSTP